MTVYNPTNIPKIAERDEDPRVRSVGESTQALLGLKVSFRYPQNPRTKDHAEKTVCCFFEFFHRQLQQLALLVRYS